VASKKSDDFQSQRHLLMFLGQLARYGRRKPKQKSCHNQALEKAATMNFSAPAREFLDFVATSKKRGICPLKRGNHDDSSM
jgi:hypothetical protein